MDDVFQPSSASHEPVAAQGSAVSVMAVVGVWRIEVRRWWTRILRAAPAECQRGRSQIDEETQSVTVIVAIIGWEAKTPDDATTSGRISIRQFDSRNIKDSN